MDASPDSQSWICPRCAAPSTKPKLAANSYRCHECDLQVAHLELSPDDEIVSPLAWLQPSGGILRGRYRLTAALGTGGFAATYLAEDLLLKGKRRAIKEIPKKKFDVHEADLLSRLQHPAIPDITDRFEQADMIYLVLQFGGSRTLESERIARNGKIEPAALIPWISELCDVLDYLHSRTPPIVHRDLKPENILLDERSNVTLIDFGIAKESVGIARTRALARCVSHGFSPPEQELGTGTDQRSDVYALGATMYALLTGRVPTSANERLAGSELIRPRKLNPTTPPTIDIAIMRALELNANRRQQTIIELKRAIQHISTGSDPQVAHQRPHPSLAAASRLQDTHSRSRTPVQATYGNRRDQNTVATQFRPTSHQGRKLRRISRLAASSVFLAGGAFAATYLYSDPSLLQALGIAGLSEKLPWRHSVAPVRPLDFRSVSLRTCTASGAPLSTNKDTFTNTELQTANHLNWTASFTNHLARIEDRRENIEARFYDPSGRQIASSSVAHTVAADQNIVDIAGIADLAPMSGETLGNYTLVLYADSEKLTTQNFFVVEDYAKKARDDAEALLEKVRAEQKKLDEQNAQKEADRRSALAAKTYQQQLEEQRRRMELQRQFEQEEQARIAARVKAGEQAQVEYERRLREQQQEAQIEAAQQQQHDRQVQVQQQQELARQQAQTQQQQAVINGALSTVPYFSTFIHR